MFTPDREGRCCLFCCRRSTLRPLLLVQVAVNLLVIGMGLWVALTKDDKVHCKQSRRAYTNDVPGITQCIADCDGITNAALITPTTPTNCFVNNDPTVFVQSLAPAGLAALCTLSATLILLKFNKATLRQLTGTGSIPTSTAAIFIVHSVLSLIALLVDAAAAIWNSVVADVFLIYSVPCALLAAVCLAALLVQIPVVHVARMNGTTTRQRFDDSIPDTPRRKTTSATSSL